VAADSVRVLIAAMQRADSADVARVLPALARIDYTDGVTAAHIGYTPKGDLKAGGITIYKAARGKWVEQGVLGAAR
jgi:branched-chain amino acid transport system substrate-binding protein